MNKAANEIIDEVLNFMYNGNREYKFSNLTMIPKEYLVKVKDTMITKNIIKKADRQLDSFADTYILTDEAIEMVLDYDSYSNYLQSQNNKNSSYGNINITASNGSQVSIVNGNNNTVSQKQQSINKIYEELEKIGIQKDKIDNLKQIVENTPNTPSGKKVYGKKALLWVGTLATDLVKKGITDKVPVILRYIENLISFMHISDK